jgi:hypothetical protein
MVDQKWIPPEQQLARTFKSIDRRLSDVAASTGTERNLTVQELQKALEDVEAVVAEQAAQLAILNSTRPVTASGASTYQDVAANSWTTGNQPSVSFTTATGRARIDVQAMLFSAGDATIATYGIYTNLGAPLVSRESRRDAWKGFTNGVLGAVGGSAFDTLDGLPVNTPLIARFEFYAYNATAKYLSPSISAAGTA